MPETKTKKEVKKYYEAVGRRKRAIARVRLFIGQGDLLINNKPYKEYFTTLALQQSVEGPFQRLELMKKFKTTIKVKGGGPTGQAEAVRHGIARALILFDKDFRKNLKKAGYLKRDPRKKERKKFGLKKARKGPQWSKR
jgi:small subunit ribosomal protein S9